MTSKVNSYMIFLKAFIRGLFFFALCAFLGFFFFQNKIFALSIVFDTSSEFAAGTYDGVSNSSPNETPIVQLQGGEKPSSTTGLEAQWNFNETSGTTISNSAGASSCGGTATNCDITLAGIPDTTGQDKTSGFGLSLKNSKWGNGALDFSTTGISSLLHGEGYNNGNVITDEAGKTWTIAGNTVTSNVSSKFGISSLYFPGSSDTLTSGVSADYNFGTSPFTIDFFLNTTKTTGYGGILQHNATYTAANAWLIYQNSTSLQFMMGSTTALTTTNTWSDGNWHHIAITRSGTTLTMYIDGVSVSTYTTAAVGTYSFGSSTIGLLMGTQFGYLGTRDFLGYIDELRITKGTALWTSNFTAPTSEYLASISNPANNKLDLSDSFSIETWVKTNRVNSTIISNNNNNRLNCTNNGYFFGTDSTGYPVFYVDINSGTAGCEALVTGSSVITDSKWHHLVATYSQSSSSAKIYLDGIQIGEDTSITSSISSVNSQIYFASIGTVLDSTRFYSRALSSAEVLINYTGKSSGVYTSNIIDLGVNVSSIDSILWTESGVKTGDGETVYSSDGLFAQWNLNASNGTVASNLAGEGSCFGTPTNCNGTLTNFASVAFQDQAIGTGWTSINKKWGNGSLMFDGVNDYTTTALIDNTSFSQMSFEGWVKTNSTSSSLIAQWTGLMVFVNKFSVGKAFVGFDNTSTNNSSNNESSTMINDNKWHYIAGTNNGSVTKLYIDGVLENSYSDALVTGSTRGIILGSNIGTDTWFSGALDSVRIYSRELSSSEILSNYQAANIQFETRTSADGITWEEWEPIATVAQVDSMDNDSNYWTWNGNVGIDRIDSVLPSVEGSGSMQISNTLNNVNWSALGESNTMQDGVNGQVNAIVANGSDIYVGGYFTSAGVENTSYIARWDGTKWNSLGYGMNNQVSSMVMYGTDLIVGGSFTTAGGVPVKYIAKWDGSTWNSFGSGITTGTLVKTLEVIGTDLYVGGTFTVIDGVSANNIAKWNGSAWSALGTGTNGTVYTIASIGADVYIGGTFSLAGGITNTKYIAKWNGSAWSALGTGMNSTVYSLEVIGTDLYAGGSFSLAGGVTNTVRIAKWDGSAWSALGTGMDNGVQALTSIGTDLYAGGDFTTAGGLTANRIAKWNGSTWSTVGTGFNQSVYALYSIGSDIYAGGFFSWDSGGSKYFSKIAKWNGSVWSDLGTGINSYVNAVALLGTDLFVGGEFTRAGGVSVNYIAKWDGTVWSPLGTGLNGKVESLAVIGTDLYVGGSFTTAGGISANGIAKWDGSTWSTLGTGLTGGMHFAYDFAVIGSDLYVGGSFTSAGGVANTANIAKWNGSSWSALGTGTDAWVKGLTVVGTDLYAGGAFVKAGGVTTNCIAKWNGSAWSALSTGMTAGSCYVHDVAIRDPSVAISATNYLYAGGYFTTAGGVAANYIARWNGSAWSALGTGLTIYPYSLKTYGSDLYVGGGFDTAGGVANTAYIAKWNGSAWSAISTGMNQTVYDIVIGNGYLYAGGNFQIAGGNNADRVARIPINSNVSFLNAYWTLDETGGIDAYIKDSVTNINGTPTGTTLVDGVIGKARSFDNVDDAIEFTTYSANTSAKLDLTSTGSIEAWIKVKTADANNWFLCKSGNYCLGVNATGALMFTGASAQNNGGTSLTPGSWHHVVVTNNNTTATYYVDGVASGTADAVAWGTTLTNTLRIGRDGGTNYFDGVIDNVKIYGKVLTANEVAENYRQGSQYAISKNITATNLTTNTNFPIWLASDRTGGAIDLIAGESAFANNEADENTVGLWHFEEDKGSGAYIKDSSISLANGTPTLTTSVLGKYGKARSFGASGNYIKVANKISLQTTNSITMQAWVNPDTANNDGIIYKGAFAGAQGNYQMTLLANVPYCRFNNDALSLSASSALPNNTWSYVVCTYDKNLASNQVKLYINGKLDTQATYTTAITSSTNSLYIGAYLSSTYGLSGSLDDVRIDNIARTAQDIYQSFEIQKRTHSVVINFGASTASSNYITSSSDDSFDIDGTLRGMPQKASNLIVGDKIIVRENYNGTFYTAQSTVASVNASTGAITVCSVYAGTSCTQIWDNQSTFPTEGQTGFSENADVFKWQQEWIDLSGARAEDIDAITKISIKFTDGSQGRNVWLDDMGVGGSYLTNPNGSIITSTVQRYIQYRAIVTTTDQNVTPTLSDVTINYTVNTAPNNPTILDHNTGSKIDTTTPSLGFNLSDPDTNNTVKYSIEVASDNVFTTPQIQVNGTLGAQGDIYYDTTGGGLTDGNWFWRVKATDNYNLSSDWTNATNDGSPAFIVDTTAPTGGSFTINSGATYTSSTSSTLNITCPTDSWVTVQMAYGTSASPTNWETCAASASQTLTSGDGLKTIYLRFKDGGDNITSDLTQTITLDQTPPSAPSALTSSDIVNGFISGAFTVNAPSGSTDTGGSGVATYSLNRCDDSDLTINCEVIASGVIGTTTEVSGADLPTNGNTKFYFWNSIDNAQNVSGFSVAVGVTMDTDKPTTLVSITEGTYYSTTWVDANTINGTASDSSGSGVELVEITIQRDSDSKYWTGSIWSDTETWLAVTAGTTSWTYSMDNANFNDSYIYTIKARATDNVGNITTSGFGFDSFTYMNEAPPVFTDTPTPTPTFTPTITPTQIPGSNTIQNVNSGIQPVLVSDWNTNLEMIGQTGTVKVGVEDTINANIKVAEMDVSFNTSPDWTGVTGATEQNKAFFHSQETISTITNGAASTFTLYILKGEGNKVQICPNATSLLEVSMSCSDGYLLSEGETKNGATAIVVSNGIQYWKVSGLTGTGGMSILTGLSDTLTRLQVSEKSDHKIIFGSTYGLIVGSTDTMTLSFPDFDLTGLTISDIELTDNVGTARTLASLPDADTWGVVINSGAKTITFTVPTSGTGGYDAPSQIAIKIGTNAGGTNQITNPSSVGDTTITITLNNTAPGEMSSVNIPIIDSDTVTITAYVTAYLAFDIDTGVGEVPGVNPVVDCEFDICLTHQNGDPGSNYTVDLGELSSSVVNKSNTTSVSHSSGGNGIINSIYFDITTNAPSGAVVTVKSANGGLQGPGTNKISSIGISVGADGITRSDGDDIPANSGVYGYTMPVASSQIYGSIVKNTLCDSEFKYCGAGLTPKTVFTTNNLPVDTARVRMDLAAAANYTNNPGLYTDTLTFIATATF